MRRHLTLFIFFLLLCYSILIHAETAYISINKAQEIADRNAATLWGEVDPGEPIVYYSLDDKVVAYRFNYAINTQFPDMQTLINECHQGKLAGNRKAQWGNGNYGNILMSARTDMPVNLEHGLGISSEYAYGAYLQEQAEKQLGSNYTLKRIYYVNTVSVWHHYSSGTKDIYIQPFAPAKVATEQEFRAAVEGSNFFCQTGDFTDEWEYYLYRNRTMSRTQVMIPYHDECCPFYDWSFGCSPTAAAMLLAYWDLKSTYGNGQCYGSLVDYHFTRYDPRENETDYNVPNLQQELAIGMGTDLSTGGTLVEDIAPGIEWVTNLVNGYSFSATNSVGIGPVNFAIIVNEIDANRPAMIYIDGHSICGVGYNDVNYEVASHYTHENYIRWVTMWELLGVQTVSPGGPYGVAVEINHPDGDSTYNSTGGGEILISGNVYEINWEYSILLDSYVKIDYSTDHGVSWTQITGYTANDGIYDWVIPTGIDSDDCRIRIKVHSMGESYWGGDGSYGDFHINPGVQLPFLQNDFINYTQTNPDYYKFINNHSTWCAVAVRGIEPSENWDMKVYTDDTFSSLLLTSAYNLAVDYIVLDGHHTPAFYRGIKVNRTEGSNNAAVTLSFPEQSINMGTNTYTWPVHGLIEMYDIYLTPGTYSFGVDNFPGSVDLDIALFGSPGTAYIGDREDRLASSVNHGLGINEQFLYTITVADYYGLCVWANNSTSSSVQYDLFVVEPGVWSGAVSSAWNEPDNWVGLIVPVLTTSVVIPGGTPHQPVIGTGTSFETAYCDNITIGAGAVLTQTGSEFYNSTFHVYGNFISDEGTFIQNSNYAYLYLEGSDLSSAWDDDNEDDTYTMVKVDKTGTNILYMLQDMTVRSLDIRGGNFKIYGDHNLTVTGELSNALLVESGGILTLEDDTIDVLYGDIVFEDGAQADISGGLIKCGGDFRAYSNAAYDIQFTGSTLEMCGTGTQYYQDLDGNTEIYNFTVNKSSGTCFAHIGDLVMKNDLTINSGTLNANNNDIYLAGDWINNAGETGFVETLGTVIFNGTDFSEITTNETFYNLTENSASIHSNGLQLNTGLVLYVINDLNINLGKFELDSWSTLIVGNDVYIANGSGLNAYGDFGLQIYVGGDWTNDNTYWDGGQGYSPGTEVITFNGNVDQFITTNAPQEDFGYLVIDKMGGEFRPNNNIHVIHDCELQSGGWHDNASSLTHYFEGDLYVSEGTTAWWNSTTDNTVVFTGLNDQTIFNPAGYHYFRNIIIDKTEWAARDISINEGTEYNLLVQSDGIKRDRNMTVTLNSDIDMQMGDGLTVEEGTLDLNGHTLYLSADATVLLGGTLSVDADATLQIAGGNSLYVYNGGILEVIGTEGHPAHITHRLTGNYGFNIYTGGLIKAQYGLFEYMTANGVYVWNGGMIDPVYSFDYCTFQNGFAGYGTFLYINNTDDVTITGADFPDASSCDFNVAKTQNPGLGEISMLDATGIFAGEAFDQDTYELINWYDLPPIEDLRIYRDVISNLIVLDWTYPNAMARFRIYKSPDPYDFPTADYITSYTSDYSEPITNIRYFYKVTAEIITD